MIEGKTKEETIELTARWLGISRFEAEYIWAIEHGETKGDVIIVDAKGKPVD